MLILGSQTMALVVQDVPLQLVLAIILSDFENLTGAQDVKITNKNIADKPNLITFMPFPCLFHLIV